MKNDSALFFVCSLIEFIGRAQKQERSKVVEFLGEETIRHIYNYADVLHCEPIEKVADEFITRKQIPVGTFDNVADCKYQVPDYWTIGEIFERLIEDIMDEDAVATLVTVYSSWLTKEISNFNSDLFYQPRDYLKVCWEEKKIA